MLLKLFHKIERKCNKTQGSNVTLIPTPDKDTTKNENYTSISLINTDPKILNAIFTTAIKLFHSGHASMV
jgi:hypothetical protein